MTIRSDPGSYKDPAGGVFHHEGKVRRWIAEGESEFYRELVKSDLFRGLVRSKRMVSTAEIDLSGDTDVEERFGAKSAFFEHERVEFLSFPYEWPAAMVCGAAAHTLDLQLELLDAGLTLKDATPYNIQFVHTRPVFIDLGSIAEAGKNGIWIAYDQFCRMFLYPLLLSGFKSCDTDAAYLARFDGPTLGETVAALGLRPFWRHGLTLDYLLPALMSKFKSLGSGLALPVERTFDNSAELQAHTARRLRRAIDKLRPGGGDSFWSGYERSRPYSDEEYRRKKGFVETFLKSHGVERVLDLGCNTGDFSVLAAENGCDVVALDLDRECVESLYRRSQAEGYSILPLCVNLSHPSPAVGWFNEERPSFLDRAKGRFDCVFALAILHHLIVTARIPLGEVARLLRHCASRYVVVEFIGTADKMFKQLTQYRTESYSHLSRERFERVMTERFSILEKAEEKDSERGMDRVLYVMECR